MGECKINVLPIIQPRKLAVERSENLCLDCEIDMLCHNLFREMACLAKEGRAKLPPQHGSHCQGRATFRREVDQSTLNNEPHTLWYV